MIHRSLAAAAVLAGAVAVVAPRAAEPGPAGCAPDGGLSYICGPTAPEDMVIVPGTDWVIAGGLARDGAPGGLRLVDRRAKTWTALDPLADLAGARDAERFPGCAAPPQAGFSAHGLALRRAGAGRFTLYIVAHGARETVEVFTFYPRARKLAWVGCAPLPAGDAANSVAVFSDGTILATVLYRGGTTPTDSFAGRPTGVVLESRPGQGGFTPIAGTELPSNNGVEVGADDQHFYVVSTGLKQVVEFARNGPPGARRRAQIVGFTPDNVRMAPEGVLLLGGMIDNQPECGGTPAPVNGRLNFTCHRGYKVSAVDPRSMALRDLAQGPRNESFSGTTTALHVGDELWLASLMGDRIAWRPWP